MRTRFVLPLVLLLSLDAAAVPAAPVPAPAVPPLALPDPVSRTLANGLRVVVFPSAAAPIVQAQLLVPAGSAEEPDSLPGLAALVARIVQSGSSSRSTEQLAADLAATGATFGVGVQRDYALAACGSRSSAFEPALEIMADVVISPRVGEESLENARAALLQQLRARGQGEARIADDRAWSAAFDPHPYAHPEPADFGGVLAVELEHVRAFVRDRWRPDRSVLAISGDVTPERAFAAAEDAFGRWAGRVAADRGRPVPAAAGGVHVLDLEGSRRAEVRVAVRGPGRAAPELPAWMAAAAALEESVAGRGISVSFTPQRDASLLVLGGGGPADSARALANRLLGALRAFAADPPEGDAAKAVQRRVAQSVPLGLETIGARLSRWQADDFAGLPAGAVARQVAAIASPGLDLAPVARAFAAAPVVFAAGPGERLRGLLAGLGEVRTVPLSMRRSSRPDTLAVPTEAELRAGREAIAATVAAHGGAERLAGAKATVYEGNIGIDSRGQVVEGQFSAVRVEPEKFSYSTRMMTFEVRQVLNGDEGWMLSLGDSASLTIADSATVRAMRAAFHNDFVHLLRAASAPGASPALRGRETVGGVDCDLLDFTGRDGQRLRLAIDRATRRVVAADAGLGADIVWHERRLFSEWKTVVGLVLPAHEDRYVDGQRISFLRARIVAVNGPTDERLFRKPTVAGGHLIPER